jgi:5-methylcytosine-specific restriction endonuclease McrA
MLKDEKARKRLRELPCLVCFSRPSDVHHIKTRGSGGDDQEFNLANLCRRCHSRLHHIGQVTFASKEWRFMDHLEQNGWRIEDGRLRHSKLEKGNADEAEQSRPEGG